MVRVDLCYQNLPVTVVGMGACYLFNSRRDAYYGDVAIASAIPNMQVIAPCDPSETKLITSYCANQNKDRYLRLGKAGEPELTKDCEPWEFGKVRYLRKENPHVLFHMELRSLALKLSMN